MKNIFCTLSILLSLMVTTAFAQPQVKPAEVSYTIDFVFTGEIQNQYDSIFALQYTFSRADFARFTKLHLEDAQRTYTVDTQKMTAVDSLEITSDAKNVYLRFKKYNKYDIPVPMQADDKTGKSSSLYLRHRSGKLTSGTDFKGQVKVIRESVQKRSTQNNNAQ